MILDKNKFYQWDLERTLEIVDNIVTEVHFKKFTDNQLYVCEVYDNNGIRVVDIPNILFTTPEKFTAYFYCNDLFTKKHTSFDIIPRPKPTDYVYTETEVKRYDTLEQEIEELNNAVDELNQKIGEIPTIIVDQNYDAKSTNPQSGQAVAQALEEFTPIDENQLIGRKTEEGGVIIGDDDDNNKALARDTFVNGNDNWAGYKGFRITKITLNRNVYALVSVDHYEDVKAYECYSVGDIVQMHLQSHYHDRYRIDEIGQANELDTYTLIRLTPTYGEEITDNLSLVSDENNTEETRNWIYVVGKPYGEPMKYSKGATSFGNHNIVTGQGALGIGVDNEVLGHGALAVGVGNKVGYAGLSNGTENEAIHNRSATLGRGLKSGRVNQLLAGEFNEVEDDSLFVVGGGTGDAVSTRRTIFKVKDNGNAYLEGDLISRDKNLLTELDNLKYQINSPDKYKIVDRLPISISNINLSSMYLIKKQIGYDIGYEKYIFNNTGNNKSAEASSIWDGTMIAPTINEEGVYIIDSAEKLAYIIKNGGTMIEDGITVNDCTFVLTKDISKYNWLSGNIGSGLKSWYDTGSFSGTIEGNFHTIYGLYSWYKWGCYPSNTTTVGLIPTVEQGKTVTINNLIIDCCAIKGKSNASAFVGNNHGGTVNINSCTLGQNVFISGYRVAAFISGGYEGTTNIITNSASYATISLASFSEGKDNGSSVIGLISNYFIKKATIFNSFNANGPICSGSHRDLFAYDCFETVQGEETDGIIVLTPEQMQGKNVLNKDGTMSTLNSSGDYWVATDTYPIQVLAYFDWIQVDDECNKKYVDEKVTEARDSSHLEIIEVNERLTKTNEELESKIYKNANNIASLQAKVEMPQPELILKDENNNKYRIFIKEGKLQMEVVE